MNPRDETSTGPVHVPAEANEADVAEQEREWVEEDVDPEAPEPAAAATGLELGEADEADVLEQAREVSGDDEPMETEDEDDR